MLTEDGFHLTYCTNIHPGESWAEVRANLERYIPQIRERLALGRSFGLGLRLSGRAVREIFAGDSLQPFARWLDRENLYVFTLNGFPYGGFHRQSVKEQVYAPDWTTQARLNYSLGLAQILAYLLPQGLDGGISTVPLSYRPWYHNQPEYALREACLNLALAVERLVDLRRRTGKWLHLDLEPEPDGVLENTAGLVTFFRDWLLPVAGSVLVKHRGVSSTQAETWLREHIQVCYDVCHWAVVYEDPEQVFAQLHKEGIRIGKVQLSSALKIAVPDLPLARRQLLTRLMPFAESPYLHQVVERLPDGTTRHYPDLKGALPQLLTTPAEEWRTHFHVPVFMADYQGLGATQADLTTVLTLLQKTPCTRYLELETYTWEVLPTPLKTDLVTSIVREYAWVLDTLYAGRI